MDNDAILRLTEVTKKYGPSVVLGPVSLALKPGEILGIRGPNGAGKTTLLCVIAGILAPDSGEVWLSPDAKETIGYVPQDVALYEALSGRKNLEFWAQVAGVFGREMRERVDYLLERVRLSDKAKVRVQEYSGGMRRRLNLAAALIKTPRLLLLDEPTVGADEQSVEIMLDMLRELKEGGAGIAFISHKAEELNAISDSIVTIEAGKVNKGDAGS